MPDKLPTPLAPRFSAVLARFEEALVVLFFVWVLGLGAAQVILRNLFGAGLGFADEAIRHGVLWVGFLGASLATYTRRHITVDVFSSAVPGRFRRAFRRLTDLLSFLISLALLWAAFRFLRMEWASGEFSFSLALPYWVLTFAIFMFFFTSTLRYLLGVFIPVTEARDAMPHAHPPC